MRVLLEFLGLPVEDADFIKQWCNDHMLLSVPGIGAAQQLRSAQTEAAFSRYTEALIAARQHQPQEDVLSALIHAQVEGERPLDVAELHVLVQQLLFRHETTTNLLSNTCYALLHDPALWHALRHDLTLSTRIVEEGLRYDAPVQGMFRTTTEDVEMRGVRLPAGARVFVAFGAANRDERIFAHPDRFDMSHPMPTSISPSGMACTTASGRRSSTWRRALLWKSSCSHCQDHLVPGQPLTYLPSLLNRALQHLQVCWGVSSHAHG